MAAAPLKSSDARDNIDRLLRLAQTDGYLTVAMTMRLLDRSQMMAYCYLQAMVDQGMVEKNRSKQRWYLVEKYAAPAAAVEKETDDRWPMVRRTVPAPQRHDGLPSWRDDALVAAICGPSRSRRAA